MAGLSTVATPPLRKGRVKNGSIFLATAVEDFSAELLGILLINLLCYLF